MKRRSWQHITKPGGWFWGATVGQVWGVGITWFGRHSGVTIFLGPLCIDIWPPAPAWAKF